MIIENKNKKLSRITTSDNIAFKYNNDVLFACFNDDYKSDYGQYAVRDTHDGNVAWFPKERVYKNGRWIAGSQEVNWKNYFQGDTIVQYLDPNEPVKGDKQPEFRTDYCPMYTFMQSAEDNLFRFVGVYMRDVNASTARVAIYRKLTDELDLSDWHNNADFEYVSNDKYLKAYQAKRNTVKRAIETLGLDQLSSQEREIYNNYSSIRDSLRFAPPFDIDWNAELLAKTICINPEEESKFLDTVQSCSADDFGREIIDLVFVSKENHNHNDLIRNSLLGEKFASRLLSLASPEFYIYSLSNEETTEYLRKLKIKYGDSDDLTEKHCLLYFWIQCSFPGMSPFIIVKALQATFPNVAREEPVSLITPNATSLIDSAMKWFTGYVVERQNNSIVDFNSGEIKEQEGYKKDLVVSANKALEFDGWTSDMIGSGLIWECAVKAMKDRNNNIVDYHNVTHFEDIGDANKAKAEQILFELFCGNDDEAAFEKACSFWGRRYDILSFLMFLKDSNKYVPVKSENHKEIFEKLKIDTSCFSSCTWKNYSLFLDAVSIIKTSLEEYYGFDVDLIDTHNFLWMVKQAPQDFKCSWTEESENKDLKEHLIEGSDPYESVVVNGEAEGQRVAYYTTKYERNAKNRKEAIRIHGFNCAVCGFNFEEQYGELGKEFIEVHHLKPLYSLSETVIINPKTDLACVCANCHRMIHKKRGAVLTIEELKELIKRQKSDSE